MLNLLSQNIPSAPNFQNLAIFICHLFIDGQFRAGHILYDPNVFDSEFISEVQLKCPSSVPWLTTDVTKPFSSPWQPSENTDHILQLALFDPNNFPKNNDFLNEIYTFYRLFAFITKDNIILSGKYNTLTTFKVNIDLSSPISNYSFCIRTETEYDVGKCVENSESSEMCQTIHKCDEKVVYVSGERSNLERDHNLFDLTFGINDRNWLLVIERWIPSTKKGNVLNFQFEIWNGIPFLSNFFLSHFPSSYMNYSTTIFHDESSESVSRIIRPKPRKFYNEITMDYNVIDSHKINQIKENHLKTVSLDLNPSVVLNANRDEISLYPYQYIKLSVLFVYGVNTNRRVHNNSLMIERLSEMIFNWATLFYVVSAIILYKLRKMYGLRRGGFASAIIDTEITFTAGGNLRMDHRIERWFFGTLLIASFFFGAFWLEMKLFPTFLLPDQKVDTFDKLTEVNPPIYLSPMQRKSSHLIDDMLRNRMDANVQCAGVKSIFLLMREHKTSFGFVVYDSLVADMQSSLMNIREFDLIQESLGSLPASFYIKSNHYVPERLKHKVDTTTSLTVENGLQGFYQKFSLYLLALEQRKYSSDTDEAKDDRVLTMDHLRGPLLVCAGFLGISCVVLIAEVIVKIVKNRKTR